LAIFKISANKETTDEELEEMLETGNVAVFTGDVSPLSQLKAVCVRKSEMVFFYLLADCGSDAGSETSAGGY
jgi:arginine repressor